MKRFVALFLLLGSLFLLTSCGEEEYKPVESSELESSVVMTLTVEENTYEVKYELYRALFLNLKSEIDGGDTSVWTGENKDYYINEIDTLIRKQLADIYGTIHAAKKVGIDIYSSKFDKEVKKYIKASVNGGVYGGIELEGFDGKYSEYLKSLKALNLNYGAQDLLLRYAFAREEIYTYYAGDLNEDFAENATQGKLEITEEKVRAFYESEECVRVVRAILLKENYTPERIQQIRLNFVEKAEYGDNAVSQYAVQVSLPDILPSTFFDGEIIAKHNLDPLNNEEVISAAFALDYFKVSDVLEFTTSSGENYYSILYRFTKTSEHFENCYDSIVNVYINNEIGKIIDTYSENLNTSAVPSAFLLSLNRAEISMNDG